MNIHEYQAKDLFRTYNIPVPKGYVANSPEQAVEMANKLGGSRWIIKAQAHTGGRGKAGGVKLASNTDEVKTVAKQIIGMTLVTKQTGPEGKKVHSVLVEETSQIDKEWYISLLTDRTTAKVAIVASAQGGMDIEEVAEKHPDQIAKVFVAVETGLCSFHIHKLAKTLNVPASLKKNFDSICRNLYKMYLDLDCTLIEINPMVLTKDEKLIALDAKLGFDENALYRHPQIEELRDEKEEDPRELQAAKEGFSYISLDGSIGCMVNGAGLAMATMDITQFYGGSPANFLDVGGSATADKVRTAFKIILSDEKVKAVLVNIFGGIMKCDVIAEGIIGAVKDLALKIPLVVRLEGTNVDKGKKLLAESGLNIVAASSFGEAAKKAVELAKAQH